MSQPPSAPAIVSPSVEQDRPRWFTLVATAIPALALGILLPRACIRGFFGEPAAPADESGQVAAASASGADSSIPVESSAVSAATSAATAEPPQTASIAIGKSTILHCQNPPGPELRPSKCGEPLLDSALVPRLEQLAGCPAAAGVVGKISISVDVNFKTSQLKVSAPRNSSVHRNGRRDDRAVEPILACARTLLKDIVQPSESGSPAAAPPEGIHARAHARYRIAYPVTLTLLTAAPSTSVAPAAAATVAAEKSATGTAVIQRGSAIVRDAPSGTKIGSLTKGARVTLIGRVTGWFHIRFGDGDSQEGWIAREDIGR